MQDFTLQHANTFFFFTSIAVMICIIILSILLYGTYKVFLFVKRTIVRIDILLDNVAEHTETNPVYKKSLPYILPILAYLFKKKGKVTKK